jgi:hypothetical protein
LLFPHLEEGDVSMSLRRHAAVLALSILGTASPGLHARAEIPVLTRSFDNERTGANTQETVLTPQKVGANGLVKLFSLNFDTAGEYTSSGQGHIVQWLTQGFRK